MILLTMLNQYLLERLSRELKIAPLNVIREHLEMEVLYYLSQSSLSNDIIFYGGTALRQWNFTHTKFLWKQPISHLKKH